MRAILPHGRGSEGGRPVLGDWPDPEIGEGEVLVGVSAAGINRADLLQLRGEYPPPPGESEVPGLECAGTVIAVGPGTGSRWAPGDRVMGLLAGGGQAERVAVPAGQLMPVPAALSLIEAAALPEAALTAWTNLVAEGQARAGESVLILGAASGVGTFAVQLARELGLRVLAAGRSRERLAALGALGADGCLVLGPDLGTRLLEATGGRGVELVVDLLGGSHLAAALAGVAERGRWVLVGLLAGRECTLDLASILRRRLRLVGSVLRPRSREEKAALVGAFWSFAGDRLADGRLRPLIDSVLPLAQAESAYRRLASSQALGKVLLEIG